MLTTVTSKGQVTIPEEIRTALGIVVGDRILFDKSEQRNKTARMKVIKKDSIMDLFGSLKSKKGYVPIEVAREEVGKAIGRYYEAKLKSK